MGGGYLIKHSRCLLFASNAALNILTVLFQDWLRLIALEKFRYVFTQQLYRASFLREFCVGATRRRCHTTNVFFVTSTSSGRRTTAEDVLVLGGNDFLIAIFYFSLNQNAACCWLNYSCG